MGGGKGSPRDLMNLHTNVALLSSCNLFLLCVSSTKEGGDHPIVWVDGSYSKAPPFESVVGGKAYKSNCALTG